MPTAVAVGDAAVTPDIIGAMSSRVVVVGSLNVDLVVSLDRMPDSGETLMGNDFEQHAGGKGLNQAVAAARLGAKVSMVGALGSDGGGAWLGEIVQTEGIDDSTINRVPGASGTALIEVDITGANRIVVVPGANGTVTAAQVEAALTTLDDIAVVMTLGEVPIDAVETAMKVGRRIGATTILNPAPVQDYPADLFSFVDYLIPNEHEAALLTGEPTERSAEATHAARTLAQRGAQTVIVTRGAKATVWSTATQSGSCGVCHVNAIDTVAAGDAFCGGFATALAEGRDLGEALRWASATAGLATTVRGAVPSLPTRQAVIDLLGEA